MQSDMVIYCGIALLALCVIMLLAGRVLSRIFKLLIRCGLGLCGIFAVNFLLSPISLSVGLNPVTALASGLLGIPGFVALYVVSYVLGG